MKRSRKRASEKQPALKAASSTPALRRPKLVKVIAASSMNMFQVHKQAYADDAKSTVVDYVVTYIANIEKSGKFEPVEQLQNSSTATCKYNKNSLYLPVYKNVIVKDIDGNAKKDSNGQFVSEQVLDYCKVYYNMYSSTQPFYKSAICKVPTSKQTGTTYDYQDTTNHKLSSEIASVTQVDGMLYALEPMSNAGRYDLSCDIWSWISVDHLQTLPPQRDISTCIYDKQKLQDMLSSNCASFSGAVSHVLTDISYNMLYEINGSIYNDFESGNIAANTFKAKNHFDCTYSMVHDSQHKLKDARKYVEIDKCNDLVYLKYYDCMQYGSNSINDGIYDKHSFYNQNIEVLSKINRFKNIDQHQTNLYSIAINTDILQNIKQDDNDSSKAVYDARSKNIMQDIKNNVREIMENIQPAHVQLLEVTVNGE